MGKRNISNQKSLSYIQLPFLVNADSRSVIGATIGDKVWQPQKSFTPMLRRRMLNAFTVGNYYYSNEKDEKPPDQSSGDLKMKSKESTPLVGLNTIRLSGSNLDHFNTNILQPDQKSAQAVNRIFERQSNFERQPPKATVARPSSKQSFVTLQQIKIGARTPKRLSNTKSETKSTDIDYGLSSLRISAKPKSTPTTILTPLKRERPICSCASCEERKLEKQKVGHDKSERLKLHQEQQKYSDPIRGATDAFIQRIRELKSYDLDTAKQEQSESKRKKKRKVQN